MSQTDNSRKSIPSIKELEDMLEDQLWKAARKIRNMIRETEDDTEVEELKKVRGEIFERINELNELDMKRLDQSSEIDRVRNELSQLTKDLKKATSQIKDFASAVDKATDMIGSVDTFLKMIKGLL